MAYFLSGDCPDQVGFEISKETFDQGDVARTGLTGGGGSIQTIEIGVTLLDGVHDDVPLPVCKLAKGIGKQQILGGGNEYVVYTSVVQAGV